MVPPDPIPNSEVKRRCADGSVGLPHVRVGHRQVLNVEPRAEWLGVFVKDYFDNISFNMIATSDFSRDKIAGLAAAASKYLDISESVRDIFFAAANEISLHIKAIGKNFESGKRIRLSYIGGVFKSEYIIKCIKEMNPDIELVAPIYPPEKGSILQV